MPPATAAVSAPQPAAFTENRCLVTPAFVILLFILWGVAITMGDVLNQHFQHVLYVSRTQSGPVQFFIFRTYAVMNIPGACS